MISLIKNELIKIFHKKSIYIMLIIILAFVLLFTIINKFSSENTYSSVGYSAEYIDMLKNDLANLDYEDPNQVNDYINIKTELDEIDLLSKYEYNSWQSKIISNTLYSYIYDLNLYKYNPTKDLENYEKLKDEYNKIIELLDSNNWRYFANKELEDLNKKLEDLQKQKETIADSETTIDIEIKKLNTQIYLLNYRLDKDIPYGNDYLNDAIESYTNSNNTLLDLENGKTEDNYYKFYDNTNENSDYSKKLIINDLKENLALSQYILETQNDLRNMNNLRGSLIQILENYEILIIILIVIISGSIVSEEFNKGTIKLLLTRPYTRNKILIAKFITTIIIIFFAIISIIIIQLIVGSICFGFDSLKIPGIVYNFNTNQIETMNICRYLLIIILAKLPLYILISTIAFFISTIFANTSIGITVALLGYMSTSILNTLISLAYKNNIKFLKYFITMHWDFNQYVFGKLPPYEYINLPLSIIVCALYFIFMITITFIVFKKKDIKNI